MSNNTIDITPLSVEEALAKTPLSYLVPSQDIAVFSSGFNVQVPEIPVVLPFSDSNALNQVWNNLNTGQLNPVLHYLNELIRSEDTVRFDDIQFKEGIHIENSTSTSTVPSLPSVVQQLFDTAKSTAKRTIFEQKEVKLEYESHKRSSPDVDHSSPSNSLPVTKRRKQNIIDKNYRAYVDTTKSKSEALERLRSVLSSLNSHLVKVSDDFVVLSNDSLLQIEHLLFTVFSNGDSEFEAFQENSLPTEFLCNLESICADSAAWAVTHGTNHENALLSSSVVFSVLLSGRPDSNLYRENYIAPIIELLASCTNEVILAGPTSHPRYTELTNLLSLVLRKLEKYLSSSGNKHEICDLNEYLITKIEYLSLSLVFASIPNIESIKWGAMAIMITIFHKQPNQRTFILDEVLNNVEKNMFADFPISHRGVTVDFFTAFILQLVHTFDVSYTFSIPIWKDFLFKSTHHETFESSIFVTDPKTKKIKISSKEKAKFYREVAEFQNFLAEEKESLDKVCGQIASYMIAKVSESPTASNKSLVESFIKDLLRLAGFPEWSGAETLLVAIMNNLTHAFSSHEYSSSVETFSLELIGLIGDKILSLKKFKALESCKDIIPTVTITLPKFNELVENYQLCLQYVYSLSTKNPNFESNFRFLFFKWVECLETLRMDFINQALKEEGEVDQPQEDELSSELSLIRKQRVVETRLKSWSALFKLVNELYSKYVSEISAKSYSFETLPEDSDMDEKSLTSYNYVLCSQSLINSYDTFLGLILSSLNHSKVKSRTRALKNLSLISTKDPSLLAYPKVKELLFQRLSDQSALVRDAVIDIMCQHITKSNDLDFCYAVVSKIGDPSTSVQRRVLGLVESIFFTTDSQDLKVLIFLNLLKIFHHEDASISDYSSKIFVDIWLTSVNKESEKDIKNVAKIQHLIVDISEILSKTICDNDRVWTQFEDFFRQVILFKGQRVVKHRRKIVLSLSKDQMTSTVSLYVEALVDFVINNIENQAQSKKVERFFGLLSIISKCDGRLITQDQLMLLQPYFTDDTSSSNATCFYTLQILKNVLSSGKHFRGELVKEASLSLLKRLTTFSVRELNEALPCIWSLSLIDDDITKISNACISCLVAIQPFLKQARQTALKPEPKLIKLLYLIGNFGKCCSFESKRQAFTNAKIGLKKDESITSIITKYILSFCEASIDSQTRRVAVRNLMSVCSSHAKLFLSAPITKIIDRELELGTIEIKETIVQGFTDFLRAEEDSWNAKSGFGVTRSSDLVLDVNVFHGNYSSKERDSVSAPLVQRYMNKISSLCEIEYPRQYIFVKFLEAAIRQGFANPRVVIGTVIKLEFSSNQYVSDIAFELHQALHVKYETLIESCYGEALCESLSKKDVNSKQLSAVDPNAFRRYYQIVSSSRSSKKKFVNSLVKSFGRIDVLKGNLELCQKYKRIVEGLVTRLAKVELSTLEEYYILCQGIDKLISKQGITVQSLYENMQDGKENSNPEKSEEKSDGFKLQIIALISYSFELLLRLRDFVCSKYRIPSSKLESFNVLRVEQKLKNLISNSGSGVLKISTTETADFSDPLVCNQKCESYISRLLKSPDSESE